MKTPAAHRLDDRPGKLSTAVLWLMLLAAFLVTILPGLLRSGNDASNVRVDPLLGTWTTADPRYSDRALTIRPGEITLGLGGGQEATYPIRQVGGEQHPTEFEYAITYGGPGEDLTMRLFLTEDGSLRLNNPPEVRWTLASDGAR
jgi:hypothetical protein